MSSYVALPCSLPIPIDARLRGLGSREEPKKEAKEAEVVEAKAETKEEKAKDEKKCLTPKQKDTSRWSQRKTVFPVKGNLRFHFAEEQESLRRLEPRFL